MKFIYPVPGMPSFYGKWRVEHKLQTIENCSLSRTALRHNAVQLHDLVCQKHQLSGAKISIRVHRQDKTDPLSSGKHCGHLDNHISLYCNLLFNRSVTESITGQIMQT